MAERAKVTSVEALDEFRANLIVYLSKARPALEEVSADVTRARTWLEEEQRTHWHNQMRLRTRALEEAQQALFSSRLSSFRDESAAEVMAVHRAKRQVEEAQTKLRLVKIWTRDFDNRVQPLLKQVEKLHTVLASDMVKAVAYLTEAIKTLDAYAQLGAPSEADKGSATETARDAAGPGPAEGMAKLPGEGK